ncbi:DUF721 domain-containing protein [Ruixingdingia sedimenti]|uniref:DciA family protein n=1 Tax=Ruixingdingia sedimenti TaxID=3073604 RepID=A0ABU1F9L1_9RHOB|nr:DciA family protein [Xinfangfangia sp. LG-4]MDR5653580.1 DciA family protein [Xinfangfangia sp. LG-4]
MTRPPQTPPAPPPRRLRGFEPAAALVQRRVEKAGESRGFAVARLLTHWAEIAGQDLAAITRPVKVGYGREGLGAVLTLLVAPAQAPLVQMAADKLKDRVNAVYGYNAIARIHLTQTAPTGFAEGQTPFTPAPAPRPAPAGPPPEIAARAATVTAGIGDDRLRAALEALAQNVLTRAAK